MEITSTLRFLLFLILFGSSSATTKVTYNVLKFGAKANGVTDSSKAFLGAWSAACSSRNPAIIYVPKGSYLLGSVTFAGQTCKAKSISIQIDGTLVAPSNSNVLGNAGNWIKFQRVNHVSISGGTLDARGTDLWACKTSGKTCPIGATWRMYFNGGRSKLSPNALCQRYVP